ncbi:hypothetical protein ILYODFUR_022919 [Ilyodon furcidens]|uniref:Uncharacterized protein n=1 Tax=Ilyodon furcidens TaxID=33524 RepID=A0ABV0TXC4_9TELE
MGSLESAHVMEKKGVVRFTSCLEGKVRVQSCRSIVVASGRGLIAQGRVEQRKADQNVESGSAEIGDFHQERGRHVAGSAISESVRIRRAARQGASAKCQED